MKIVQYKAVHTFFLYELKFVRFNANKTDGNTIELSVDNYLYS